MQRFAWRRGFEELRNGLCKLFNFVSVNRFDNRLSTREMAIERADADAGATGNFLEAHLQPGIRERGFGSVDQYLSIPGAVRAGLSRLCRRLSFHL